MAENKKDKSAEFARDKSAFGKGGSEKGTASQKAQHKHSGTHQPRDANDTSRDVPKKEQSETFGQNVQKSGQSAKRRNKKQYQKQDTFGHSENPSAEQKNLKSENMDADSKGKSDFSQENNTFTEDCDREQEEHQQKDDYHRRDTYHQSQKKENTTDGSIRTGNGQNNRILNVISRRRKKPLRKEQSQSFMEAKN